MATESARGGLSRARVVGTAAALTGPFARDQIPIWKPSLQFHAEVFR